MDPWLPRVKGGLPSGFLWTKPESRWVKFGRSLPWGLLRFEGHGPGLWVANRGVSPAHRCPQCGRDVGHHVWSDDNHRIDCQVLFFLRVCQRKMMSLGRLFGLWATGVFYGCVLFGERMFRHHSQAGLQANVKPRPWGVHCFPSDTSRSSLGSERFQPKEALGRSGAWIGRFPQPQDTLLRQIPAVSQNSRNFDSPSDPKQPSVKNKRREKRARPG